MASPLRFVHDVVEGSRRVLRAVAVMTSFLPRASE
jgi:hypothetical protein